MKKTLLSIKIIAISIAGGNAYAQCGPVNIANSSTIYNCDSAHVSVTPSGATCYTWYDAPTGGNIISTDNVLMDTIYNTTTYYVEGLCYNTPVLAPLPAQTTTYSNWARGYWFQAPTDFLITGLRVPTDASASPGIQSVGVVRFDSGAPPTWTTTTNLFTLLGYWNNVPAADTISACIQVHTGDYIGILGNRDDVSSYAPNFYTSNIAGIPVDLTRLGMQFPISSTAPQDLYSVVTTTSSISRVEMYYSILVDTSVREPVTVLNCTGIPEFDGPIGKLYPNPVNTNLTIELNASATETVRMSITDASGKLIMQDELNESTKVVNIENLETGIYFVALTYNGYQEIYKIVKE